MLNTLKTINNYQVIQQKNRKILVDLLVVNLPMDTNENFLVL